MAGLFQGDPLPAITKTTEAQQSAPEFYTNYLQDIANLGQNAVQQGGIAGFSPLQQQAFQMAPDVAFAGAGSMGAGSQLLGEAGATTVPDVIADYMNPYTSSVVNEMGRLTNRNIQENILPNLGAAAVGSGQFGSQRQAQVTGQSLRDIQSDLIGRQAQALQTGYTNAGTQAQTDLSRALSAGQSFGNLGTQQQALGLGGLGALSSYGGQQQTQGQKLLDYPMAQAQQFSKLMQGYQMPMGTTTQSTGSEGYSNSPLSQIAGLGTLMAALFPAPTAPKKADGGVMHKVQGGLSIASQDDFQKKWDDTKAEGYKGDAVADRQALANALSVYQTNQNLANMYGITQAPAQNQFLTDFNKAEGFDPTTSANLMKGMSDATTMANMNKEIGDSNFHYTGEATAHPNIPYQLNPSEQFIKSLVAENTANPNKGSGNAIMNQFLGDSKTTGNPFLGEYTWNGTLGVPVRKDANGNPIQSISALTSQQLTDLRNGPIPVYKPASQSTNSVGDVFILKDPVLSQENDASGYMRITSGGKEYTINPNSKRIIRIDPVGTYQPYGSASLGYNNMANGGGVRLADGGMAPAGAEYTDGNGNYYDADGYLLG